MVKMYAVVYSSTNGGDNVCLYDGHNKAEEAMKTSFAKIQFQMMKDGFTFGKSPNYFLKDDHAALFADGCIGGHMWSIMPTMIPKEWLRKRKLNLFSVVKLLREDEITICWDYDTAKSTLTNRATQKKEEFLDNTFEVEESYLDGYAMVHPKGTFDFHSWAIIETKIMR